MRPTCLLALGIVAACGPGDPPPPDDPCAAAAGGPGSAFELGLGSDFTPIVEGQDVTLELGLQGLWMFVVDARASDAELGAGELAGVTAVASFAQTGELASLDVTCRVRELVPAGGGYVHLQSPYLLPLRPELGARLEGARISLELEVRDAEGRLTRDERTVVAHLPAAR